jgi:hypothetical protein
MQFKSGTEGASMIGKFDTVPSVPCLHFAIDSGEAGFITKCTWSCLTVAFP